MLFFGGFLLLAARVGDVFGRKRLFLAGLVLFTAASLAVGLAPSAGALIGARAVQGIGAAILAPSVLALISTNFPEGHERTRALATYSMVAGVGSSLGLVLGGIFASQISWRAGFFMNVPIGLVLILTAACILDESERHSGRFDIAGAITSTLGMAALDFGIVRSAEAGWTDPVTLWALAASAVLLALFVWTEARVAQPMLPLRLFASRERSGAYLARMLFLGAMVGFFFFSTQLMQGVMGFSPLQAGFGFLPMTIPTLIAAMLFPRFTTWMGNGGLLTLSLVLGATGLLWLGQAAAGASYWTAVASPLILIGLGNGFALGPLTVAGVAGVENRDAGAASGLVNVAHQLGGSLGLGILVVVFANANNPLLGDPSLLAHRISAAVTSGGLFLCLATVLVLVLIVRPRLPAWLRSNQALTANTAREPVCLEAASTAVH